MYKKILSIGLCTILVMAIATTTFAQKNHVDEDANKSEEELKEEALKEPITEITPEQQALFDLEIYEAFQRVESEENYIVDLINSQNNGEFRTTKANWEFNLNFLKENYQLIQTQSNVNMVFVDSYIEAYEFVLLEKDMPLFKENTISTYSSYDRSLAVDYAYSYAYNFNSSYPDWSEYGGDCANFVSQCLYAGGKSMVGTPGTAASATNFANWFSFGTSANTNNVSSTWRGADAFKHYWKANAVGYKTFTSFTGAFDYGYTGDAVTLLNSNDRGFHTLVIIKYGSGDLIYAAHSEITLTGSLKAQANSYDFIIYNMK